MAAQIGLLLESHARPFIEIFIGLFYCFKFIHQEWCSRREHVFIERWPIEVETGRAFCFGHFLLAVPEAENEGFQKATSLVRCDRVPGRYFSNVQHQ